MLLLPSRPYRYYLAYAFNSIVLRYIAVQFFGVRVWGANYVPQDPIEGGYLVVSNHQSHFDPPLIGTLIPYQIGYVARDSLFGRGREDTGSGMVRLALRVFGFFIHAWGAIPISRTGRDARAFDEIGRSLAMNRPVVVFPEGTRTLDGEVQTLKRGIELMVRRFRVPILPVGLEGTFQSFPAGCPPLAIRRRPIHMAVGPMISADTMEGWGRGNLSLRLGEVIKDLQAKARTRRQFTMRAGEAEAEHRWSRRFTRRREGQQRRLAELRAKVKAETADTSES